MFGSLPTHVRRYFADPGNPENYAWRTLLFRRQPNHPNAASINAGMPGEAPDHLIMDLFWMPTVEPYAISEPFASAGKVNMNYQIQPFTYLERKTAMIAVLRPEKIPAIPSDKAATYKTGMTNQPAAGNESWRDPIDPEATLTQFDDRFDEAETTGRIFLSPTELCDLWLVPQGQSATESSMQAFWASHNLTGDNLREKPYANIVPKLTTKSNTFTIHFRVQQLKPRVPNAWDEDSDTVAAEYRGSTTIERFIDPNIDFSEVGITDYALTPNPTSEQGLGAFYRWRTVNYRAFAP
jgi:uncharacterized protein (TIGR02600 family)